MEFSVRCGDNVEIFEEGTAARRLNYHKNFNGGVAVTKNPLCTSRGGFGVTVKNIYKKWSGTLEVGLTSHDPRTMTFPSQMTALVTENELTLMFSGKKLLQNNIEVCNLPPSAHLTDITENDSVCVRINTPTNISLIINDIETRFDIEDISDYSKLYGVVDLYGHCTEVKLQTVPCPYYLLCQCYLHSILPPAGCDFSVCFDKQFDKCYCEHCLSIESPLRIAQQKRYTIDKDWVKFAINVPPQAYLHKVFDLWHVAYHGTSPSKVKDILQCGELLFPGDRTPFCDSVKIADGHFTSAKSPPNFDVNQIFMTPSIKYCSAGNVYAKREHYHDSTSNVDYEAQVIFKLKVAPGSYEVCQQTLLVSPGKYIDRNFSNSELEWSTKLRKSIILYGLLIRLKKTS